MPRNLHFVTMHCTVDIKLGNMSNYVTQVAFFIHHVNTTLFTTSGSKFGSKYFRVEISVTNIIHLHIIRQLYNTDIDNYVSKCTY